jgi:beta-lactamase class A
MLPLLLSALVAITPSDPAFGEPTFRDLETAITRLIQASGADLAAAIRTIDGAGEVLIQADVRFHAASTIKVAVMIELFRQSEEGRLALDDALPVRNQFRSIVDGSPYQLDVNEDSDKPRFSAPPVEAATTAA